MLPCCPYKLIGKEGIKRHGRREEVGRSSRTAKSEKYKISTVPNATHPPKGHPSPPAGPINVVDAITSGPQFNLSYDEATVRNKLQYSSQIRCLASPNSMTDAPVIKGARSIQIFPLRLVAGNADRPTAPASLKPTPCIITSITGWLLVQEELQ